VNYETLMSMTFQFKMKRNPRKLKWTKAFRKAAGKEMTVDSTLTFAARRNIPTRYNRDLVATTLGAMARVSEIRSRRERVFYKNRMAGNKQRQLEADRKLVAENSHLLPDEVRKLWAAKELEEQDSEREETMLEDDAVKVPVKVQKGKGKQRVLASGGVDEMDVD
jgi:large subunit ribosomal protein L24e